MYESNWSRTLQENALALAHCFEERYVDKARRANEGNGGGEREEKESTEKQTQRMRRLVELCSSRLLRLSSDQ